MGDREAGHNPDWRCGLRTELGEAQDSEEDGQEKPQHDRRQDETSRRNIVAIIKCSRASFAFALGGGYLKYYSSPCPKYVLFLPM